MATKVISLSDKSLTSSYNAYNDAFGNTSLDTPSIAYYGNTTVDLTANGIPAGSTINGVVMYALYTSALHGYSIRDCSINGTTAHTGTWANVRKLPRKSGNAERTSRGMSNIIDYMTWRGDIPLSCMPFNAADNLVLSLLAYILFENFMSKDDKLTVRQAAIKLSWRSNDFGVMAISGELK